MSLLFLANSRKYIIPKNVCMLHISKSSNDNGSFSNQWLGIWTLVKWSTNEFWGGPELGGKGSKWFSCSLPSLRAFLVAQLVKNLPALRETWVRSPGLRRSPGEGKGYPLQYSGLENSTDCIDHGVAKSRTQLNDFHFHLSLSTSTYSNTKGYSR